MEIHYENPNNNLWKFRPDRMRIRLSLGFTEVLVKDNSDNSHHNPLFQVTFGELYPANTWFEFPLDINKSNQDTKWDIYSVLIRDTVNSSSLDNFVTGFEVSYSKRIDEMGT